MMICQRTMPKTFAQTRELSIQAALEWAFGTEHAQLDFDDLRPEGQRAGRDTIATMMDRGMLGCKIDGGGRSRAADDAEVIANVLAALPVAFGGRPMAISMAEWARAGAAPDWMPDATPRCVPVEWRNTKHGYFARAEVVSVETVVFRGRKIEHQVLACPITYAPSAQQIGMARRRYLDWYGALLHLRHAIDLHGLTRIRLTSAMPPLSPWRSNCEAAHKAA